VLNPLTCLFLDVTWLNSPVPTSSRFVGPVQFACIFPSFVYDTALDALFMTYESDFLICWTKKHGLATWTSHYFSSFQIRVEYCMHAKPFFFLMPRIVIMLDGFSCACIYILLILYYSFSLHLVCLTKTVASPTAKIVYNKSEPYNNSCTIGNNSAFSKQWKDYFLVYCCMMPQMLCVV